jgi:hypothetical protein
VSEIIEGVSATSPRDVLFGKIRELNSKLFAKQDARLAELQRIEEDVKRKFSNRNENLLQIISTSTEKEWHDGLDFLSNFEDYLPVALYRVYDGARTALGRLPAEESKSGAAPAAEKDKGGKS